MDIPRIQLQSSLTKMKVEADEPFSQNGTLQISVRGSAEVLPASLVLVMDCSGSMAGRPMELLNSAIDSVANSLGPEDVLSIVAFGSDAEIIIQDYTRDRLFKEGVPQLDDMGSTNYKAAMDKTKLLIKKSKTTKNLDGPSVHTLAKTILFMSDGHPDFGQAHEKKVLEFPKGGYSFHTMGMGDGVDPNTLLNMAEMAGGLYRHAKNENELQEQLKSVLQFAQGLVYSVPELEVEVYPDTKLTDIKLIAPARVLQDKADVGSHLIKLPDIPSDSMMEIGFTVAVDNPGTLGQQQDLIEWKMYGANPEVTKIFWVSQQDAMNAPIDPRPVTAKRIYEAFDHLKHGRTIKAQEVTRTLQKMGSTGNSLALSGATAVSRTMKEGGGVGKVLHSLSQTKTKKDGTIGG